MSFKHKKKIHEILEMDFETYAKFLKKETLRAAKFGELDAVFCTNHKFGKDKESSLILMGAFVGDLASYFKKNKAKPGFAKGKCFFETTEDGVKMHIAINSGKGKPDKITKVGRKLWKKAGLEPLFHDKLPFLDEALGKVKLGETELVKVNLGEAEMKESADTENNNQAIKLVKNNYLKSRKMLQDRVLPLISNKETLDADYTNQHFKIAKACLKNAASFLDKFEEINADKQALYQKEVTTIRTDEYPKLRRIAVKIKQALMANNAVDIDLKNKASLDAQEKEGIDKSLGALDKEFERLEQLKTQAIEASKYLDKSSKK
jgi:hypothetical protein